MRNLHLVITLYTFFTFSLHSQERIHVLLNPVVDQEESKTTLDVNLNKVAINTINTNPNQILNLVIPLSNDITVSSILYPRKIYGDEGLKIRTNDHHEFNLDVANFYVGKIEGQQNSKVLLAVGKNHIRGSIYTPDGSVYSVHPNLNSNQDILGDHFILNEEQAIPDISFSCETVGEGNLIEQNSSQRSVSSARSIGVHLECDYLTYQVYNDIPDVALLMGFLFLEISDIFWRMDGPNNGNQGMVQMYFHSLFINTGPDGYSPAWQLCNRVDEFAVKSPFTVQNQTDPQIGDLAMLVHWNFDQASSGVARCIGGSLNPDMINSCNSNCTNHAVANLFALNDGLGFPIAISSYYKITACSTACPLGIILGLFV